MSDLLIREFDPDHPTKSKRISVEQWAKHEARIRALHAARYRRIEVLQALKNHCGCEQACSFAPSPSQYYEQLRKWNLRVYKPRMGSRPALSEDAETSGLLPNERDTVPPIPIMHIGGEVEPTSPTRQAIPKEVLPSQYHSTSGLSFAERFSPYVSQQKDATVTFADSEGSFDEGQGRSSRPQGSYNSALSPPSSLNLASFQDKLIKHPGFWKSGPLYHAACQAIDLISGFIPNMDLEELLDSPAKIQLLMSAHNQFVESYANVIRQGSEGHPDEHSVVWDQFVLRVKRLFEKHQGSKISVGTSIARDTSTMITLDSIPEHSPTTSRTGELEAKANLPMNYEHAGTDIHWDAPRVACQTLDPNSSGSWSAEKYPQLCSQCDVTAYIGYKASTLALQLWDQVSAGKSMEEALKTINLFAGFFCGARASADAFDLYFILWTASGSSLQDQNLAAALNCARTSATSPQDICARKILHRSLLGHAEDSLSVWMVHFFLAELNKKIAQRPNSMQCYEVPYEDQYFHQRKANLQSLDPEGLMRKLHANFPDQYHIATTLYTRVYTTSRWEISRKGWPKSIDPTSPEFQKSIREIGLVRHLLVWCTEAISARARVWDVCILENDQDSGTTRLFCLFLRHWFEDRSARSSVRKVKANFERSRMFVAPPEALSIMASLIYVPRVPDTNWSLVLLKNIESKIKSDGKDRDFVHMYSALITASEPVQEPLLRRATRTMLWSCFLHFRSSVQINVRHPWHDCRSENSVEASSDELQTYELHPVSGSNRYSSSQSSFSSSLNSMRQTAVRTKLRSVLSLAKRQSVASLTPPPSIVSSHSSWSFTVNTRMPRAPSIHTDVEMMDYESGTNHEEHQDEEMA